MWSGNPMRAWLHRLLSDDAQCPSEYVGVPPSQSQIHHNRFFPQSPKRESIKFSTGNKQAGHTLVVAGSWLAYLTSNLCQPKSQWKYSKSTQSLLAEDKSWRQSSTEKLAGVRVRSTGIQQGVQVPIHNTD